ncbi:MAG: DUF6232 family protein [Micromonosporaceae bacterium]
MSMLFRARELQISDDWIRGVPGTFAIRDIRSAWVTRRARGRARRRTTIATAVALGLITIGWAGASGWLTRNWSYLLYGLLLLPVAASIGFLDPVAIWLEKRHHELWIATDAVVVLLWRHNRVEVNKALRAINRACERHRERLEP